MVNTKLFQRFKGIKANNAEKNIIVIFQNVV